MDDIEFAKKVRNILVAHGLANGGENNIVIYDIIDRAIAGSLYSRDKVKLMAPTHTEFKDDDLRDLMSNRKKP